MNLKDKLIELFKSEAVEQPQVDTNSEAFKKAVEDAAERMVDEQLKQLDKEFVKSISSMIKPTDSINEQSNKTKEEQVKEILNNEHNKVK